MTLRELDDELRARGIPEYAEKLAERFPYDPMERKKKRNPIEWELINEARRKMRQTGKA